jgi:predicted DNA-binding transcriptional regulator YafY
MKKQVRSHGRINLRLVRLDEMIRKGCCRSAAQAGEELEVDQRTIMRDFDLLRDCGAKLEYSPRDRCWRYIEKSFVLPAMQMTEGELVAIFLAERLMHQYRGAPFEAQLHNAFAKIVEWLPEQVTVNLSTSGGTYSFEIGPTSNLDPVVFEAINRSISERLAIEINYYSQNRGELTMRRINPYHLHNHRGDWYVIAYDHLRGAIRDFHLSRIHSFTLTKDRFPPPDFDRENYLKSGFEMYRGGEMHLVEIEFDAYQARWIRERKKWHDSEERDDLTGGGLLLRMRLAGLDAVKRFVMQYGAHARVRRPDVLREMIEQELLQMSSLYGIKPPPANSGQ